VGAGEGGAEAADSESDSEWIVCGVAVTGVRGGTEVGETGVAGIVEFGAFTILFSDGAAVDEPETTETEFWFSNKT
jgi:hypothetical protein